MAIENIKNEFDVSTEISLVVDAVDIGSESARRRGGLRGVDVSRTMVFTSVGTELTEFAENDGCVSMGSFEKMKWISAARTLVTIFTDLAFEVIVAFTVISIILVTAELTEPARMRELTSMDRILEDTRTEGAVGAWVERVTVGVGCSVDRVNAKISTLVTELAAHLLVTELLEMFEIVTGDAAGSFRADRGMRELGFVILVGEESNTEPLQLAGRIVAVLAFGCG